MITDQAGPPFKNSIFSWNSQEKPTHNNDDITASSSHLVLSLTFCEVSDSWALHPFSSPQTESLAEEHSQSSACEINTVMFVANFAAYTSAHLPQYSHAVNPLASYSTGT
jgi:hypothetical protein